MSKKKNATTSGKTTTVLEKYQAIQRIGTEVPIPWEHWRMLGGPAKIISIMGPDICIGEDYGSLEECRGALEWYVNQLGGKVTWET